MGATAVSSSTLNPDAPLFIPAAFLQVEDFSPQWWSLVTTTAWFRDHWSREHSHLDDMAEVLDAAALLPDDDDDLFLEDDVVVVQAAQQAPAPLKTGTDLFVYSSLDECYRLASICKCRSCRAHLRASFADAVLKALNPASPKGGDVPRVFREKPRHAEKPAKHAGSPKGGAPRVIHQPR